MIRKAQQTDIKALISIESATFTEDDYPLSRGSFYYHIKNNPLYIFTKNGKVVGYILWFKRKSYYRLYSLSVLEEYRKIGVAQALFEHSLEKLKAQSYTLEVKTTNNSAIKFYEKNGFKKVKILKGFYPKGQDGLFMKKPSSLKIT